MDQPPENLPAQAPVDILKFAPSLIVLGPGNQKFSVPTTPDSNRAFAQITVSRVRAVVGKTLQKLEEQIDKDGAQLDLKTLKTIAEIVKTVEDTAALAYGQRGRSPTEEVISDFAALSIATVKAAAQGAAEGAAKRPINFNEKLQRMKSLGRQATGHGKVIDVTPEPEPELPPE